MAVTIVDFSVVRGIDFTITVPLAPPVAIGGWSIEMTVQKRFGGLSGLINKYVSSGMNNQSGINITNSGLGIFNVNFNACDTSGLDFGTYVYEANRLDSGSAAVLAEGALIILPR